MTLTEQQADAIKAGPLSAEDKTVLRQIINLSFRGHPGFRPVYMAACTAVEVAKAAEECGSNEAAAARATGSTEPVGESSQGTPPLSSTPTLLKFDNETEQLLRKIEERLARIEEKLGA